MKKSILLAALLTGGLLTTTTALAQSAGDKYIVVKNVNDSQPTNTWVQIQPLNCQNNSINPQAWTQQFAQVPAGQTQTFHFSYMSTNDQTCGPRFSASPIGNIGATGVNLMTKINKVGDIYGTVYLNSYDNPTNFPNINAGDTVCIAYDQYDDQNPVQNVYVPSGNHHGKGCRF